MKPPASWYLILHLEKNCFNLCDSIPAWYFSDTFWQHFYFNHPKLQQTFFLVYEMSIFFFNENFVFQTINTTHWDLLYTRQKIENKRFFNLELCSRRCFVHLQHSFCSHTWTNTSNFQCFIPMCAAVTRYRNKLTLFNASLRNPILELYYIKGFTGLGDETSHFVSLFDILLPKRVHFQNSLPQTLYLHLLYHARRFCTNYYILW